MNRYLRIKFTTLIILIVINAVGQECSSNKLKAEIFSSGKISKENIYEFGSAITKNYQEIYFGVRLNQDWKAEIRYAKKDKGEWSIPQRLDLDTMYTYNDPFLSDDENRLYFVSNMPIEGQGKPKDFDIWYMERKENRWMDPIHAGEIINSEKDEFYISISNNGTIYFVSNSHTKNEKDSWDFDIYYSNFKDSNYQEPIRLKANINSEYFECDPFIAPDESYLIFSSSRPGGFGEGDLYISFKDKEGNWTKPINMGDKINSEYHEFCPQVTKDGKFLFYTCNGDIYKIDSVILRNYID